MANEKNNSHVMAALAYLLFFISGIALLLIEKKDKFVRFHAAQSTVLYGGLFIVNVALGFIPFLGWLVGSILWLVGFILWIFLMWKAFNGETYRVPYVAEWADKLLAKLG